MGRNKDLRRKIEGLQRVIAAHQEKIQIERRKDRPNESYIAGWLREISTAQERLAALARRLAREW